MGIAELYENTELTIQNIADELSLTYKVTWSYIKKNYTKEYRKERKRICYRNSKLKDKNPAFGKFREQSLRYHGGTIHDGKGYLIRIRPLWFTGRKGSRHVFEHHIVWCEANGYTEIPKGFCIHHCDCDPLNNSIDNLLCVSLADHSRIHQKMLKSVTTISKESTAKWLEVHGKDWFL